jgi:hypothetical protein
MRSLLIFSPKYYSSDQTEKNEMCGACSTYGERRGLYRGLVGKPEGKRPFGRPRCRWKDDIKMDIQEVGCGGKDWFYLVQYRDEWRAVVNSVMNLEVA